MSAPVSALAGSGPSSAPLIGGALIAAQWSPQQLFWAAAVAAGDLDGRHRAFGSCSAVHRNRRTPRQRRRSRINGGFTVRMSDEIVELEDFALELARTAGGIAHAHFRQPITVENKGANAFDPVTNADRAIERVLRRRDRRALSRARHRRRRRRRATGAGEYTWFIDPIDGTRAFMTGSPLWGTLIGLTQRAAAVVRPARSARARGSILRRAERELAHQARAARSIEEPRLQDAGDAQCSRARIPTCSPATERARSARVAEQCLLTRFGGDCYNYAMLAAGHLDLVVESQLKPYDIVPLIPLLEGAGCIVTDWRRPPAARRRATSWPPAAASCTAAALEALARPEADL